MPSPLVRLRAVEAELDSIRNALEQEIAHYEGGSEETLDLIQQTLDCLCDIVDRLHVEYDMEIAGSPAKRRALLL